VPVWRRGGREGGKEGKGELEGMKLKEKRMTIRRKARGVEMMIVARRNKDSHVITP
jgi:hypothetical protein